MEVIETDRLVLRRLQATDAQALFDMNANPDVVRYMTRPPSQDIVRTIEFLERCQKVWEAGEAFAWMITFDGGSVGVIEARVSRHGVELGYLLGREAWGNGYMVEAARAVTDWAFSDPSIHRVWAYTNKANVASQRVLEKIGMTNEGTLHRWVPQPYLSEVPADAYMYAIWK